MPKLKEVILLSWDHWTGPGSSELLGVFTTEAKSDIVLQKFKKLYPDAPGFAVQCTIKLDEFSMTFPEC
jgi:hypothetical protein